jgi:hypothetical protein
LFVLPSHRGRGIGLGLMRALARIALERGCRRFQWQVLDWNTPAIRFYESLGARVLGEWQSVRIEGEALEALAKGSATPRADRALAGRWLTGPRTLSRNGTPTAACPSRCLGTGSSPCRRRGAGDHHQRQEVLLARVCAPRSGAFVPLARLLSRRERSADSCVAQPGVELLAGGVLLRIEEALHVVVGHAAADDEDAIVAQWQERAPHREVLGRVEPGLERELQGGYVGLGPGELERHEGAVVEASLGVARGREASLSQELRDTRRERGRARRRPSTSYESFGKP